MINSKTWSIYIAVVADEKNQTVLLRQFNKNFLVKLYYFFKIGVLNFNGHSIMHLSR